MSPHGIAGRRTQVYKIRGITLSIGQTPKAAKFRCTPTRSVRDICCQKSGSNFTNAQMPLIVRNFIALSQAMYTRKALQIFLHPSVFWRIRGTPGPKFTHLGQMYSTAPSISLTCQSLFRSDNPSARYLLPNSVDFVDGVSNKTSKPRLHIPCGDNNVDFVHV